MRLAITTLVATAVLLAPVLVAARSAAASGLAGAKVA